ncbi:glycoside hydrolase family 13 protein [Myriangium duriaei CBS 260.36]|uniref:Glycoside hydrolase family 13 protein n=1 Tax=Myriangium duriaei CBS 260.36 TaxID=1168546 RepID=A0A9P4MLS2_9PEZI|nr:glycoside hydrolase family 13 protein [Myriangium duriaei CBS 260.36]
MTVVDHPWWKNATVYQIYPASFKDSNGDGIGDLNGILSELDYIKSIGVDAIWICPMYDSPQIDMGYDISDYENVYPPYGTVAEMERLISACHERGLRVLLDLVINHTSHLHKWFQESRSSKTNPKRDWYIWRPARYDTDGKRKPPNNWRSTFGGSVWQWDEHTQEYYLHLFCPEQPDFNWENEEARKAMYETSMRFWLNKGVDGFRVDTVNMYSKDPAFADAPVIDPTSEFQFAGYQYCNGPRMHEFLGEMNEILSEYGAMTVGELPYTKSLEQVLRYVSAKERQLSMTFQFDVVDVGLGCDLKYDTDVRGWKLSEFKDAVASTQKLITGTDAWTTAFLENHDNARSISRFGSDATEDLRSRSGKMLAMLLASLSGTLFIYQGQEIGMVNAPKSWDIEREYQDIESQNYLKYVVDRTGNDATEVARAKAALQHLARDHARVPMQWDDSPNAGFTTGKSPWMRTIDNYAEVNVKNQVSDKYSVLSFWRQMLQLRKSHQDVLVHGDFRAIDRENESTFVFEKRFGSQVALVALNFSDSEQPFDPPSVFEDGEAARIACNYVDEVRGPLRPFEGRIYSGRAAQPIA